MCTLAAFVAALPGYPLLVAANRDEYLARAATPPLLLRNEAPRAMGGRDLVAGGTWLGVSEHGLVVGVLNRRSAAAPDPNCRSRGQLALELLACPGAAAAASRAAGEPAGRYNPFNLLAADPSDAFVVSQRSGEAPRVTRLSAGLHLLSNLDLNDPTCPRIATSRQGFAAAAAAFAREGGVAALVGRLQSVLGDHVTALDPRGPGSLCVHAGPYGTRSSSVLLVPPSGRPARYFHAEGPPCQVRLQPVELPF